MKTFILVFILVFSACSSKKIPIVKYPTWFANTPLDSSSYYYGVGEGVSKNDAVTNALNEIASKISTSISSTINTSTVASIGVDSQKAYTQSSARNIINEVKKIEFSQYELIKSSILNNKRYVALVKIDRAKNSRLMLDKIKNKIKNYKNTLQHKSKNVIQNIKRYSKIFNNINNILLPRYFSAQSLFNTNTDVIDNLTSLKTKINKYKNSISFSISSKHKRDREYVDAIIAYISNQGYVATSGNRSNGINIVLKSVEKNINALDRFIFKSKITIIIKNNNKILNQKIINIGSSSRTSFVLSKSFALKKFEKKLVFLD